MRCKFELLFSNAHASFFAQNHSLSIHLLWRILLVHDRLWGQNCEANTLKNTLCHTHFEANETFSHVHVDHYTIVRIQWSLDAQEFPVVLRVEDQPNESIVLAADFDLGDSWLEVATVSEWPVPILWRNVSIWHCEPDRINVVANVPVQPRNLIIGKLRLLLALEETHWGPVFDSVGWSSAIERWRT